MFERVPKYTFLRLPVEIDVAALLADYRAIPDDAWHPTFWPYPHVSVHLLLLRGGSDDTEEDFFTPYVANRPVVRSLPYMRELIDDDGPFGGAQYAFILRMVPGGVSHLHTDSLAVWHETYRVHVPITSNPGAKLVRGVDARGQHLGVGEVWTFDNQAPHAAVNGDGVRAHLIMDVPGSNPDMADLVAAGTRCEGEPLTAEEWARVQRPDPEA